LEELMMKLVKAGLVLGGLVILATPTLLAKDPPSYEKGVLLSMNSASCGYAEKDGKTMAGEILGTDSGHKNTQQVLCQEYVLQSDRITYRVRPKDMKHEVLLPVGDPVEFRIHKDEILLRDPEADNKERPYTVISMQPRENVKDAQNSQ
jgi:hypothetical protein